MGDPHFRSCRASRPIHGVVEPARPLVSLREPEANSCVSATYHMTMRMTAKCIPAFCLLFLLGCPPKEEKGSSKTLEDLSASLREIENLRAENRRLRKEMRDRTNTLESLQAKLQALEESLQGGDSEEARDRIRELNERIRTLEADLEQARRTASPEVPGPDPDEIARVFLSAIRRGDRKVVDSVVDWEGLLETALRASAPTPREGGEAVEAFRALEGQAREDRVERARTGFFDFLQRGNVPSFATDPLRLDGGSSVLRVRFTESGVTDPWDVLLASRGGSWKVVGLVRVALPPPATPERTGEGEEGTNPGNR
ncbi:MAG: hypothetical protein ACYTHM_18545 [Planctomycetota bacterium]